MTLLLERYAGLACGDIAIADTTDALVAIAPEWEALWRMAEASPFQSPAWLLPWWRAFGTSEPRVVTLRTDGVLKGILPLYLLDEGDQRKLLLIGVGITDYCDALIAPDLPTQEAAGILLHAALANAERNGTTSCALTDLPPRAALQIAAAPEGWREVALPQTPCPVLTLPAAQPDALKSAVPTRILRKIRQSRHRAERSGGWSTEVASEADAPNAWRELARLHRARWDALGHPGGVLSDPDVQAFHDDAIPLLAAAGVLRMQILRLRDRIAAVYYTMTMPRRLLFYLSAFDGSDAFASPGTLLLADIVERSIAEGVRELHFLRGAEAYKYAWGAIDRLNTGRLLIPR